jgi:hypothetical protein
MTTRSIHPRTDGEGSIGTSDKKFGNGYFDNINIETIGITGTLNEHLGANVASASTINLTTATGNFLHITGTTAITAVTLGAGMRRELIFDGILTLTHHATNNNLPGVANITTAVGDRASYYSDGTTVYCTKYVKADGTPIALQISSGGEILQLKIFNNVTTPNTKMDITANNVPLYDTSYNQKKSGVISLTADLGASGANGLDTGSKANSTAYFLYVIGKTDGTMASLWSLSATAPTMPTDYIYKRRVSWNKTDSSGNLNRIFQYGRKVQYVNIGSGLPLICSGSTSNVITATSISNFIPTATASNIDLLISAAQLNNYTTVSPNSSYGSYVSYTNPPAFSVWNTSSGQAALKLNFVIESTNIYYSANSANSYVFCMGWEENL